MLNHNKEPMSYDFIELALRNFIEYYKYSATTITIYYLLIVFTLSIRSITYINKIVINCNSGYNNIGRPLLCETIEKKNNHQARRQPRTSASSSIIWG